MNLRSILFSILIVACALIFQACPKSPEDLVYASVRNKSENDVLLLHFICPKNGSYDSSAFAQMNYHDDKELYERIKRNIVYSDSVVNISLGVEQGIKAVFENNEDWFIIFNKEKFLAFDWSNPNAPRDYILKTMKVSSWDDYLATNFTINYP